MAWSRIVFVALLACLAGGRTAAETLLLEFTSPTCGPCHAMRPVMQQLAAAGYKIREVDASRERDVAMQYKVTKAPTFVVLVDGKERARWEGGGQTATQLAEMIHKSAALAANTASQSTIDFVDNSSATASNASLAAAQTFAEPQPGRVVPLDSKPPVSRAPRTSDSAVAGLIAATVRLNVTDPQGKSTGTGTIVDSRQGKALVLTCGHIFRDSQGQGEITISLFAPGANGAELRGEVEGTLIDYDLDRDLALVCFVPEGPMAVAPIAPVGTTIQPELSATSVGCANGANPTPWATRITAVNRYQGHPNIEASGAPVEGRSGGGLFNAAGQLIGVCNAADPEGNEGLYAGLDSIHQKLDSLGLSFIHQAPSLESKVTAGVTDQPPAAEANQMAHDSASIQVRGQDPAAGGAAGTPAMFSAATVNPFQQTTMEPAAQSAAVEAAAVPPHQVIAAPVQPAASVAVSATGPVALGAEEQAALAEINRRGADSEVICIITPKTPGGQSAVIKLNRASPAFVQALGGSSGAATAAATDSASPAR